MTSGDDRLKELVRGACESDPVPDFETSWRRAEVLADERRRSGSPSPWRWALGPAVAVGAAACVALLIIALGPTSDGPQDARLLALADAGAPAGGSSPLADLESPDVPASPLAELGGTAGESVAAAEVDADETRPGYGLYEAGTDFLLTMEIPAWERAGERNVL